MRIAFAHPHPDLLHGSERSMLLGAKAVRGAGHEVTLVHGMMSEPFTGRVYDRVIQASKVFDRRSKIPARGFRKEHCAVLKSIVEGNDLIHVHGYPRPSALRAWIRGVPTIITAHVPMCPNGARYHFGKRQVCERAIGARCFVPGYTNDGCGYLANGLPFGLLGFIRSAVEDQILRHVIKRAATIICPGNWMKDRLIKDGIPPSKLEVIFPPIESLHTGVPQDNDRRDVRPPAVLFAGRLTEFKGPDHLLRASVLISAEHEIWIAGEGDMRNALEDLAESLGILGRVRFFGSLSAEELGALRRNCRAVVVPSLWPETFGMAGAEAMLAGVPVVAYGAGSISDWLEDGTTGVLVRPGDIRGLACGLEAYISDPEKAAAAGAAAQLRANNWVTKNHAELTLRLYEQVLAESGNARVLP